MLACRIECQRPTKNVHAFAAVLTLEEPAVLENKRNSAGLLLRPRLSSTKLPELDGLRGRRFCA